MKDTFHKTDGALLGSCGDVRHEGIELGAYIVSQQLVNTVAVGAQAVAMNIADWRAARKAKKEMGQSALVEHEQVAQAVAVQRQREALAPRPALRPRMY